MTLARGLFWAQAVIIVALALRMVTTQRLVRSLALHAITLFVIGLVYLTIGSTFMGAVQVMVYAGSVTILLVFALMMTPVKQGEAQALDHQARLRAALTALAVLGLVVYALVTSVLAGAPTGPVTLETAARSLFTTYAYPFELLSLVLLAALVGVAAVAGRVSGGDTIEEADAASAPGDEAADGARPAGEAVAP